jgi:cell division protease FtsH
VPKDPREKSDARKPREEDPGKGSWPPTLAGGRLLWLGLVWALLLFTLLLFLDPGKQGEEISYSRFKQLLSEGQVVRLLIEEDRIKGELAAPLETGDSEEEGEAYAETGSQEATDDVPRFIVIRAEDPGLVDQLVEAGVEFRVAPRNFWTEFLAAGFLPLLLLIAFAFLLFRRAGMAGQSAVGFGKSPAKVVADREIDVRFEDVAGCDEAKAELAEVVAFLKDPEPFTRFGARVPHGLLLVGPPGTGKTLLARAVAGEAEVPFFSLSGSDFVEMFVGVGAARVRDLFQQAKALAPCIIFMDELDAIGRRRGVHMGNVNDEREHTLNQLLVELDGFDSDTGVILLSATNRPDVLDPALLRPGRFDRQVVLDAPDRSGRLAILKVHSRGKPLAPDVDLESLARSTPGFSGADLANTMNEAALLASRGKGTAICQADLEEAVEKVVAGPERKSRRLSDDERRRVAYHESGHALVAAYCEHSDPVHKISIVPRGRAALGYTLQLPTGDRHLVSYSELIDRLRGLLGGLAAESLVLSEGSSGAEIDLEQATAIARQLVCQFGMGESAGLTHCVVDSPAFLSGDGPSLQRDCSEEMARAIDEEVKSMLDSAHADAMSILEKHRDELERVAERLLECESLEEEEFMRLLDRQASSSAG